MNHGPVTETPGLGRYALGLYKETKGGQRVNREENVVSRGRGGSWNLILGSL